MRETTSANSVRVIFFDDIRGSSALKERLAERTDEQAFQELRKEHDALVSELVTRDGAGKVIKSTGDGILAVFYNPSVAVERAIELQERLHGHPHLSVRVGLDMGEVRMEYAGEQTVDVFGRHVDWAARAMSLAEPGHICVTSSVYTDAFSWLTKSRIAWQAHGQYRVKPGEPALDIYEPYNANIVKPIATLAGTKVEAAAKPAAATSTPAPAHAAPPSHLRLVRPWEAVARDGREFAEKGGGMMYWFKVPLGGICYPEGFRSFLQPAMANENISKIRFLLDASNPIYRQIWHEQVLPLASEWAKKGGRDFALNDGDMGGRFIEESTGKRVEWVFIDLSAEFSPCFKLFVDDPDNNYKVYPDAQIFLSTSARMVRFGDGKFSTVRIPDAILRVGARDDEALLHALNSLANQWDPLFG